VRKIRVSVRLAAGFGSVTVLLAVIAAVAWLTASGAVSALASGSLGVSRIQLAGQLKYDATRICLDENSVAYDFSSASDPSGDLQSVADDSATFQHDHTIAATIGFPASAGTQLAAAASAFTAYTAQSAQINADFKIGTRASVARANAGVASLACGTMATPIGTLLTTVQAETSAVGTDAQRSTNRLRGIVEATAVGALLLAIVLWLTISRSVTVPLARTADLLDAVAAGDLTRRPEHGGRDEISRMTTALDSVLTRMQTALHAVAGHADTLASQSEQLSAGSQRMGDGAIGTAQRAQAVSSSATTVSENVAAVSAGTGELSTSITEIARNAADAARVGALGVTQTEAANLAVARLGASSEAVAQVVNVITAIAAQTNLLALNATIEAARAGELGAGFGVVANEVKELARQTASATDDIAQRIATIQADTDGAITAIQHIGGTLGEVTNYQTAIAGAVEEQTATVHEIGRAVTHAAATSSDIAARMTDLAGETGRTTSEIESTRSSAVQLARTARELRDVVALFTV
jgi:methyl-accepting chemotaxis protein